MGLVWLAARWPRWAVLLPARREAAPRAVPGLRDRSVAGKARAGLVSVRAPEGDPYPGRCLATFRRRHRARASAAGTRGDVVFAPQRGGRARGAASPPSPSPRGPAPTRLPRMALPLLIAHPSLGS